MAQEWPENMVPTITAVFLHNVGCQFLNIYRIFISLNEDRLPIYLTIWPRIQQHPLQQVIRPHCISTCTHHHLSAMVVGQLHVHMDKTPITALLRVMYSYDSTKE
jgi:hypothetical protein